MSTFKEIRRNNNNFIKSIKLIYKIKTCKHNYISDTQITFLLCIKCGDEQMFKYDKNAFRLRKLNKWMK